jgi:hypothetical protein
MEERERLEEANERIEEELTKNKKSKSKSKSSEESQKAKSEEKEREEGEEDEVEEEERVLSEEEIDERCEVLRQKLLKEAESGKGEDRRKNLKRYQVHELAEAKIEESERLRKALGIREDRETGEISSKKWERRRD